MTTHELPAFEEGVRLNLGAGLDALEGYVNVDRAQIPGVDAVWDLDYTPWPWQDDSIAEIRAFDVFEHVIDPLAFMAECHRVLQADGLLNIHTTHWQTENSFTDPTHRRFCTEQTFDYWIEGTTYNLRYGPAYARGRHFRKRAIFRDGQELVAMLTKLPLAEHRGTDDRSET